MNVLSRQQLVKQLLRCPPNVDIDARYFGYRNPYESEIVAKDYAKFRPKYPRVLAERIVEYSQKEFVLGKQELLIDVGCGSGQSTTMFQPYFKRIIALDISEEQIKLAKKYNSADNIKYLQGFENYLPSTDKSADVIATGSAAHWFDLPSFYKEVDRVLIPFGCLAIFGYWTPKISPLFPHEERLSEIATIEFEETILKSVYDDFFKTTAYMKLKNRYQDIFKTLPYRIKTRVDDIYITKNCSFNYLRGYMKSSDSYQPYIDKKTKQLFKFHKIINARLISSIDYVEIFLSNLKTLWKIHEIPDDEEIMRLEYRCFLILAKNVSTSNH